MSDLNNDNTPNAVDLGVETSPVEEAKIQKVEVNDNPLGNNIEVVDIAGAGIPTLDGGKIKKPNYNPNKKPVNKGLVGGIIGGATLVIVIIVVVALFFTGAFNTAEGFGDTKTLAGLKAKIQGTGSSLSLSVDDVKVVEQIAIASGAILKSGDGEVAEIGQQASFNCKVYANVSDQQMQGQKGGVPRWQEVESTWDEGQTMPVTLKEKSTTDLSTLVGGAASQQQTDPTMTYLNDLLVGQKVGTVFGLYIPGTAASGQPAMFVLGELDFVGEVGSDPTKPEVSYNAPADAPEFEFDDAGVPTKLKVPESFNGGDELIVKVLSEGDGDEVKATDSVKARYAGYLLDGTSFDSSYKHGTEPTSFSLSQVIKGWKYGIAGTKVGSKLEILIPSKYGYGEKGSGDVIPPNSYLVFYVELVGIQSEAEQQAAAMEEAAAQQQAGASASMQ